LHLIPFTLIVSNGLVRKKERWKKGSKEGRTEGRISVVFLDSCEFQMMLNFSQRWCAGRMDF